jgi:hypothetical protein
MEVDMRSFVMSRSLQIAIMAGVLILASIGTLSLLGRSRSSNRPTAVPSTTSAEPELGLLASTDFASGIDRFAVDEKAGLLVLTTREMLSVYRYPGLAYIDRAAMQNPKLIGFVVGGIVVSTDYRREIRILSSINLDTVGRITGPFICAATNRESSLVAVITPQGTLRTARLVGEKLVIEEPKPFPHATTISTMAVLADGSLLYATTDCELFLLSPPYLKSAHISTQNQAIVSLHADEINDCFTTEELGAFRVWRLSTRRPRLALFAYVVRDGERRRLDLELGAGDADPQNARPHADLSPIPGTYSAAKALFACADPWPKTGRLLVVSTAPFSLLCDLDNIAQMHSAVHLSPDGARLLTLRGGATCWDLVLLLTKMPNGRAR